MPPYTIVLPSQSSIPRVRNNRGRSRSRSPHRSPHCSLRRDHRGSLDPRDYVSTPSLTPSSGPSTIYIPSLDPPMNEDSTPSNIAASFTVPGRMTILSEDGTSQVTIAEIPAAAELEWVCVPKRDTRVYLRVS
jgi:hypothetical protein